jgi:hypothetical protein
VTPGCSVGMWDGGLKLAIRYLFPTFDTRSDQWCYTDEDPLRCYTDKDPLPQANIPVGLPANAIYKLPTCNSNKLDISDK